MGQNTELHSVGKRATRVDGPEMVTGRAVYADDVQLRGMLYGRLLRSPHAHARILGIDTRRAMAHPGVVAVLTGADVPDPSLLAKDEVVYHGQKVALVAAESRLAAEDALGLIDVDYEVLPAVIDPVAAMAPDAPRAVFDEPEGPVTDASGRKLRNVTARRDLVAGDVEKGFAEADAIVEAEFRVPFFHQAYLEPNVATARVEADGRITIWSAAQGAFSIRDEVARLLGVPIGRVRVVVTKVGGAFGAKNDTFLQAHAALLAMRTGRPVKVTMNRREEFLDGRPAPGGVFRLKMGAKKDGTLTALEGRAVWDGGWTGSAGGVNRLRDLYRIPNVKLEGFGVRTNKPEPGAYRAPGTPQTAFAREAIVDMLARKLGLCPLEFRLKNAIVEGDVLGGARGPTPRIWLKETIRKTAAAAEWGKRPLKPNQGRGIACGEWTNASGPTHAFVALNEDGSASLVTGQVDITGVHTTLAQIVAEELGVPASKVTVQLGDTDTVPYTSLSAGSKSAYSAGTAARRAAQDVRKRLLSLAAEALEAPEESLRIGDEGVCVAGSPDRRVSLADLARSSHRTKEGPVSGQSVIGRIPTFPSYSVDIATVAVDPETGKVAVIDLVAGQDVGKALNPALVEGQIQGGVAQGIGFGMMEGYQHDAAGHVLNANLLDYKLPTVTDVPPIRVVLVEEPCPEGPYGAKGVGEPPIIPGAAAIANAVDDAVGARVTEAPLTPARVRAAMRGGESANRRERESTNRRQGV